MTFFKTELNADLIKDYLCERTCIEAKILRQREVQRAKSQSFYPSKIYHHPPPTLIQPHLNVFDLHLSPSYNRQIERVRFDINQKLSYFAFF